MVPMMPPESDRKTASVRNCRRISRRVAPSALRMPISRMRACTLASMLFMMPTPADHQGDGGGQRQHPGKDVGDDLSMSLRTSVRVWAR